MKGLHTPLLGGSSASHSLGALHVCVCVCVCMCVTTYLLTGCTHCQPSPGCVQCTNDCTDAHGAL
jgi:hypothetical protein